MNDDSRKDDEDFHSAVERLVQAMPAVNAAMTEFGFATAKAAQSARDFHDALLWAWLRSQGLPDPTPLNAKARRKGHPAPG